VGEIGNEVFDNVHCVALALANRVHFVVVNSLCGRG
jgi:hypothetical protein